MVIYIWLGKEHEKLILNHHFFYSTGANTTAVLIRVALCQKVHFLCQILDYNNHFWAQIWMQWHKNPLDGN